MNEPYEGAPDTFALPTSLRIHGLGFLLINAYVILSGDSVLVDTSIGMEQDAFLKAPTSIIDPSEVRWIWLTHDDLNHCRNLQQIMELAPKATLATHPLCPLRMTTSWPVPLERVQVLSAGESIRVGDRELMPIRLPLFDNPLTVRLHDGKTGALFSADSFGGFVPREEKAASGYREEELA
jgi:flavorubredoxin